VPKLNIKEIDRVAMFYVFIEDISRQTRN